jgi:glycosyltransferase involved in cell wall biosynthesis
MSEKKTKIIRIATTSISLDILLRGQLSFLNKYYEIIAVSGSDIHLEQVHEREAVEVKGIRMKRKINILYDLFSILKLIVFFYFKKPFIVHSITPKAGLLSMLASKIVGTPIRIHTFTGLIFPSKKGFLKKILIFTDKILCLAATNIYAEGQGVKNDLIKYNITNKPINIISNGNINGINCEHYNPLLFASKDKSEFRKKLGIQDNDFVFLFVGRLVTDKGINELVNAFAAMKYENIKLILLGKFEQELDPLKDDVLNTINNCNKIITPGFVNDVRIYYSISDLFVFPSYREGFPNVVLQSAAMGLPSIVTNINGSNEIIVNDFNGKIIPPKDTNALLNAMIDLFENSQHRNYLATNARESICSKYCQNSLWLSMKLEYDKLINGI